VLQARKYLSNDSGKLDITEAGRLLSRIYGERDLLVAESLAQGIWSELDAPSLAAIVSTLVYEPRREDMFMDNVKMPKGAFVDAFQRTRDLNDEISHSETEFKLPPSQPLQPGLAWAIHRWSQGARLDEVLRAADQPVGDFVRWTKQTIDLLDQISHVADRALASRSVNAIDSLKRGVVAYSGVL
jgi:ATP-dependent RNA helicase HelY